MNESPHCSIQYITNLLISWGYYRSTQEAGAGGCSGINQSDNIARLSLNTQKQKKDY